VDRLEVAAGVEVTRDLALFLRHERTLVISDLHLGFEGALAEQGVSIPRFQRRVILERLGRMLDRVKAERVVVAGDFKHEFSRNLVDEWVEVKQVLRFLKDRVTPVIVRGNHDNYLATILGDLGLRLEDRADFADHTIVHGHEDVSTLHPIVMGHEHPALKFRQAFQVSRGTSEVMTVATIPAFLVSKSVIVLPAFSPLALGVDVSTQPYLSPILNRTDIDGARVIGVDERDGLMDFGRVKDLTRVRAALLMK